MSQYSSIYSMHAYICMPFDAHINCIIYMEYHRVLYHLLTQLNRNTSCHKYILVASTILYHHCNTPLYMPFLFLQL